MNCLGEKGFNNGNSNNKECFFFFLPFLMCIIRVDLCRVPILQMVNTGLKSINKSLDCGLPHGFQCWLVSVGLYQILGLALSD